MNFWTPRNCSVVTIQGLLTGNKPQASVRCSTNRFTPAGKQDQSLMSLVSSKCCNEMIPQKKNTPGTPFCRMLLWMSAREIMWVSTKRGWEGAKTLQGSWHSQVWEFNLKANEPGSIQTGQSHPPLTFSMFYWMNERLISTTSPFHPVTSLKWRYKMLLHLGPFPSSPARPGFKKDATRSTWGSSSRAIGRWEIQLQPWVKMSRLPHSKSS